MLNTAKFPPRETTSPPPFQDSIGIVELSERMAQIHAMQQKLTSTVQQQQALVIENKRRVYRGAV